MENLRCLIFKTCSTFATTMNQSIMELGYDLTNFLHVQQYYETWRYWSQRRGCFTNMLKVFQKNCPLPQLNLHSIKIE